MGGPGEDLWGESLGLATNPGSPRPGAYSSWMFLLLLLGYIPTDSTHCVLVVLAQRTSIQCGN